MDNRRIRFILLLSQKKYCPPSPRLLFLSRSYFVFNIRYVHMIPASTKIFPRDPLGAILNFRRRDVERLEVSQRIFNLFSAFPPLLPIRPRNRFDSYAIYHRASIKELPDALDWFPIEVGRAIGTLEQRCYRLLRSRCPNGTEFSMENGEMRGMGGCNWLIGNSFARNFANSIYIIFDDFLQFEFFISNGWIQL